MTMMKSIHLNAIAEDVLIPLGVLTYIEDLVSLLTKLTLKIWLHHQKIFIQLHQAKYLLKQIMWI